MIENQGSPDFGKWLSYQGEKKIEIMWDSEENLKYNSFPQRVKDDIRTRIGSTELELVRRQGRVPGN